MILKIIISVICLYSLISSSYASDDSIINPPNQVLNYSDGLMARTGLAEFIKQITPTTTSIDLFNNNITDADLAAIAPHLPKSLTSLDLGCNKFSNKGIFTLKIHMPPNLVKLSLFRNNINGISEQILKSRGFSHDKHNLWTKN